MNANSLFWKLGAFSAGSSIALQAYAGHKPWSMEKKLVFCRGWEVQFSSAIGMMLLANYKQHKGKLRIAAGAALGLGSILFSHIFYYRCFYDDKRFNHLIPYGGGLNMGGWILMACL
jgi:uncharacterized membrane protein YgdD (TMEM256/DUF423 family)